MRSRFIAAVVVLAASAAHADDLAALRAQLPASKCALGAAYAKANDLPRAAFFLDGCPGDDARRVERTLEASRLSKLSISSDPPGLVVTTDALPGETITLPAVVWVKAGTYAIVANGQTTTIRVAASTTMPVLLDHRAPKVAAPRSGTVDITSDEPTDAPTTTQPPDQQHPSLLPCKYRGCDTHDGEAIDDPFALRAARVPVAPPVLALGLRVGASAAFHDGGSRIAPSVALDGRVRAGRIPHVGPAAFDLRLDWAERGGDDGHFDAFGASAQVGAVVLSPSAAWLWAFAGVRGALRTSGEVGAMPVARAGVGYTAALELALRALPVTVGLRYDEDLTALVPGVRERAVIVELGGDLRAGLRY
jgi:hypothetical protein